MEKKVKMELEKKVELVKEKTVEMAAYTDAGAAEEKNQDRVLLNNETFEEGYHQKISEIPCMAIVCDGVGGYAFGEKASESIVHSMAAMDIKSLTTQEEISEALRKANDTLLQLKTTNPDYVNMLTTIAGLVLQEDKVLVFHAGDSRVYRFRGSYLTKLTRDHSLAQEMIDCGMIGENPEEALAACSKITRFMGGEGIPAPQVQEFDLPPQPGDLYLLCTDGIWSALTLDQMEDILTAETELEDMAAELAQTAIEQGSLDNLSVCLIRVAKTT